MDSVRIAAVGCSGIFLGEGEFGHLAAIAGTPEAALVAVCDVSPAALTRAKTVIEAHYSRIAAARAAEGDAEGAERLRAAPGSITYHTDLEELLKRARPQVLDVCTPPRTHHAVVTAAAARGVHVMCEKPMARTWLEAEDMAQAVRAGGVMFQYNEQLVWADTWYNWRKLLDSGAVGDLVALFLPTAIDEPGFGDTAGWHWNAQAHGGGALLDMAVHPLALAWFLAGLEMRPTRVRAAPPHGLSVRMPLRVRTGRFSTLESPEDDAHVLVELVHPSSGAWVTAHVEGSWGYQDSPGPLGLGTLGTLENVRGPESELIRVRDGTGAARDIRPLRSRGGVFGFPGEIRNMCRCVQEGKRPLLDESFGAEVMAMTGAAYLSQTRARAAVALDDFRSYARGFAAAGVIEGSDRLIAELQRGIAPGPRGRDGEVRP